ncbi:uncharacterized protein LOC119554443 [Drosophila subpulchrella]|uniref:uncharacterized protein LOC119554443 n=1 Tax=Drosophila subpulchrella TaxID=1486046 RepID=UPI0018A18A55|nr:uncharacterized protein LOC119554443 [Drosophila subpulchrella]
MEDWKTLLHLPLEVLDFIFKQLSPSNKLMLADSHPILAEAFLYHVGDVFKKLSLRILPTEDLIALRLRGSSPLKIDTGKYRVDHMILPSENVSILLRLIGSSLLEIDTGEYRVENMHLMFKSIQRHCINLESIITHLDKKNVNAFCSLLLKSEKLKTVGLSFYHKLDEFDPEYTIHVLHQLPNLRKLRIGRIPDVKIDLIQQLVDLVDLDLCGRYVTWTDLNIFEVCAPLKKLRSLRVCECNVNGPFHNDGLSYQVLEKLGVASCEIDHQFPFFPKLKYIDIRNSCGPLIQDLERTLLKHGNTLEKVVLIVEYFCQYSMLRLVKNCRNLRYLYVHPMASDTISKASIISFINILKENGVTPQNPFKLTVLGNTRYMGPEKVFEEEPISDLLQCWSDKQWFCSSYFPLLFWSALETPFEDPLWE